MQKTKSTVKTATLVNRALLTKVSVSCFIGNPRDKKLTQETEDAHNTERKRLSVRKKIMQGDELNACMTAAQALRKDFERLSLPWFDGGFRLVPSEKFIQTKAELDKRLDVFKTAVAAFIAAYDVIIDRDKKALNGTFDASDYPNAKELESKFAANLEFMPLPIANADWRIAGIDATTAKQIATDAEQQTAQRLNAGKAELLARAREAITHLADKLGDADKRFKANSIANVIEAAQDIIGLNVTEDKTLADLSAKLEKTFGAFDPDAIREDKAKRSDAIETCGNSLEEIEKTLAGIF